MRRTIVLLVVLGVAATAVILAADAPYMGKWKLNPAKSQLTGETMAFDKMSSGELRFTSGGESYIFDLDGKDYPVPAGLMASWKAVDPSTWESTIRLNGRVSVIRRWSVRGAVLTAVGTRASTDGRTIEDTAMFTRISGGPGFLGIWRSSAVQAAGETLELSGDGSESITLKEPEHDFACNGRFDGKDYPASGRLASAKLSYSFTRTGPRSFRMLRKTDGRPVYVDELTVSEDGKTLTDLGTPTTKNEPTTAVYERQ
jgi:hypothetical protein